MEKPIRIVLIESSFLIISGVEKMISEFPGMLLTEVFDGSEKQLVEEIGKLKPDVLVINPEKAGSRLNLILKTFCNSEEIIAIGICKQNTPPNIESHFRHKLFLESEKHDLLLQFKSIVKPILKNDNKEDFALTEREKNILRLVALGLTSIEIAEKLFLSIHTVNTHRKNILKKLGIKTVSGLMVYALMNEIVSMQEIEGK
ncbi:MAG TPA: response regulator transcription factor [Bacteroidales bacterium]